MGWEPPGIKQDNSIRTDDSDPEWMLSMLTQSVPGTRSAVLSEQGLAIAQHGLGTDDADRLAAIASGLFSQARQAAVTFDGRDGVRQVIVEASGILLFASSAGGAAVLTVIAGRGTDLEALGSGIGEVVRNVQPFLASQPRIRGAVTRAKSQNRESGRTRPVLGSHSEGE